MRFDLLIKLRRAFLDLLPIILVIAFFQLIILRQPFPGLGKVLVGALFGLEVERFLPGRFRVGTGAVVGAGLGNAVSDTLAGLPISVEFGVGTGLGCLAALVLLPVLRRIRR